MTSDSPASARQLSSAARLLHSVLFCLWHRWIHYTKCQLCGKKVYSTDSAAHHSCQLSQKSPTLLFSVSAPVVWHLSILAVTLPRCWPGPSLFFLWIFVSAQMAPAALSNLIIYFTSWETKGAATAWHLQTSAVTALKFWNVPRSLIFFGGNYSTYVFFTGHTSLTQYVTRKESSI